MAVGFTWLIIWTALACVFAMTLGYSRIPYAAAKSGDFFRFAYLHPTRAVSRGVAVVARRADRGVLLLSARRVINAAVTVRIVVQFIGQIVALHLLRTTRPDVKLPFRMWLYPLPSAVAFFGWLFVLGTAGWLFIVAAIGVVAAGAVVFAIRESLRPSAESGRHSRHDRHARRSSLHFATILTLPFGITLTFCRLGFMWTR